MNGQGKKGPSKRDEGGREAGVSKTDHKEQVEEEGNGCGREQYGLGKTALHSNWFLWPVEPRTNGVLGNTGITFSRFHLNGTPLGSQRFFGSSGCGFSTDVCWFRFRISSILTHR